MSTHTENLAAVIPEVKARLVVESRPIPTPGPGEVVVRNYAIAVNPVDAKIQQYKLFVNTYPNVLGSDACGEVIAVGPEVTLFNKGDRVTGFASVIYTQNIDHGAWQTYTVLPAANTTKIPDNVSYEEGSVFPMAVATAGVGIFHTLGLPRPTESSIRENAGQIFLVWGGSSSVGALAVQIARACGYTVFATASPSNYSWIEKLGVTKLFNYRDSDVVDQIVAAAKAAGKPINLAYDAVGEGSTLEQVPTVIKEASSDGKGKICLVLPWPEGREKPEGIELNQTLAFLAGTKEIELGKWLFNDWLQNSLADGSVVPVPPVQTYTGGMNSVQKIFDDMLAGVSGKKLVLKLD